MNKNFNKGFAPVVIVLIVVGILVVAGGIYVANKKIGPGSLKLRPEVLSPKQPTPPGQPGQAELFYPCQNFALGARLGYPVTNDNQAFDILRKYWFSCPDEGPLLEDCIPKNMTGDEAIIKEPAVDPYFRYTAIQLENNRTIKAWVLNWSYAVDKAGNVYGCYFD